MRKQYRMCRIQMLMVFLLLTSSCGMNAKNNGLITTSSKQVMPELVSNDPLVIPSEYLDVIEHSNSITWYLLDAFSETPDTTLLIGGGEVLNMRIDSLEERVGAVTSTLTYPESFPKSDYVKECTFLPDIAMKFIHDNDTVVVAYSFYCDLCRFQKGHRYRDYDGELIRKSLLQFALEMFPKERFLRDLNRKER